jgi:hypothetical protein
MNAMVIGWALIFRNTSILFVGLTLLAFSIIATQIIKGIGKRRQRKTSG